MSGNPPEHRINHHLDIADHLSRLKEPPSALPKNLLDDLRQAALQCRRPEIIHLLKELLPSYTPS